MTIQHFGQHDDSCFSCRVKSVSFSASSMPTRNVAVSETNKAEKKLVKDMSAFKAMRDQGIQPGRLDGAADLQNRATTKREIETGRLLPKKLAGRVETAAKELNL